MTQKNASGDKNTTAQQKSKKPYLKPDFRFERVFETLALACGKINNQGLCRFNRKRS